MGEHAKKKKILCFSTPFDETAVKLLEKINCPFYKIASFEKELFSIVQMEHSAILDEIESEKVLNDTIKSKLESIIKEAAS